jgi:hypothetical protein
MRALAAWGFGVLAVLVVALWFLVGFNVFGSKAPPTVPGDGSNGPTEVIPDNLAVKGTLEVGGAIDAKAGAQVQGNLTVDGDITVVGTLSTAGAQIDGALAVGGDITIGGNPFGIGGVQSNASFGLESSYLNNFIQKTFYYQRYGRILHVSGVFTGVLMDVNRAKIITFQVSMPSGYTLSSPNLNRMVISGVGSTNLFDQSNAPLYIANACFAISPSRYDIWFVNTNAQPVTSLLTIALSFSVYLEID